MKGRGINYLFKLLDVLTVGQGEFWKVICTLSKNSIRIVFIWKKNIELDLKFYQTKQSAKGKENLMSKINKFDELIQFVSVWFVKLAD